MERSARKGVVIAGKTPCHFIVNPPFRSVTRRLPVPEAPSPTKAWDATEHVLNQTPSQKETPERARRPCPGMVPCPPASTVWPAAAARRDRAGTARRLRTGRRSCRDGRGISTPPAGRTTWRAVRQTTRAARGEPGACLRLLFFPPPKGLRFRLRRERGRRRRCR